MKAIELEYILRDLRGVRALIGTMGEVPGEHVDKAAAFFIIDNVLTEAINSLELLTDA